MNMHDVDFLPVEYRQKHARRQSQPWQVVVAAAIVGLAATAAIVQNVRRHRVAADLATIDAVYRVAISEQNEVAEGQKRLQDARARAELYTYLRHPWPRTQLLAALIGPLPDAVTLQSIQILRESPLHRRPPANQPPTDPKAEEARLKSLAPAERDLEQLRRRLDSLDTVVVLSGTATDIAALHQYIGDLENTDIFEKAELDSFHRIDDAAAAMLQFRAVLAVHPGYGQPDGPVGVDARNLAGRSSAKDYASQKSNIAKDSRELTAPGAETLH